MLSFIWMCNSNSVIGTPKRAFVVVVGFQSPGSEIGLTLILLVELCTASDRADGIYGFVEVIGCDARAGTCGRDGSGGACEDAGGIHNRWLIMIS